MFNATWTECMWTNELKFRCIIEKLKGMPMYKIQYKISLFLHVNKIFFKKSKKNPGHLHNFVDVLNHTTTILAKFKGIVHQRIKKNVI